MFEGDIADTCGDNFPPTLMEEFNAIFISKRNCCRYKTNVPTKDCILWEIKIVMSLVTNKLCKLALNTNYILISNEVKILRIYISVLIVNT